MSSSTREQRRSRANILEAAADLASLEGLEQVSMGRLATIVGMSKSGLYAHFGSKEELQLATIGHAREIFEHDVLLDPAGETERALAFLLDRWLGFYERRVFPGGCFVIVSAVEFAGRPGAVRDALEAAIDVEVAALRTEIERSKSSGELRGDIDAGQLAFELHAILMSAHALSQVKNDPAVFDRARVAIDGLIGDPTTNVTTLARGSSLR